MAGRNFIISEQSLRRIMKEGLNERIDEGGIQKLGNALLYGALGAGSMAAIDQGLQNQDAYEQSINQQTADNQKGSTGEFAIQKFLMDNQLEDTPENRQRAIQVLSTYESRKRADRIIAETIRKYVRS